MVFPLILNKVSAFRMWRWGPHGGAQPPVVESGDQFNFCRKRNLTSHCGGQSCNRRSDLCVERRCESPVQETGNITASMLPQESFQTQALNCPGV